MPDFTNIDRIETAWRALRVVDADTNRTALIDLLANLLHWSAHYDHDFDDALAMARIHFDAERNQP